MSAPSALADDYRWTMGDEPTVSLDMRLAVGAATDISRGESGMSVDAMLLGRIGMATSGDSNWQLTLLPEVGVSAFETESASAELFVAGIGMGAAYGPFVVGVVPSLVQGSYSDAGGMSYRGSGGRVTAIAELMQIVGVQVSGQVVRADGQSRGQVIVSGSINLLPLLLLAQ